MLISDLGFMQHGDGDGGGYEYVLLAVHPYDPVKFKHYLEERYPHEYCQHDYDCCGSTYCKGAELLHYDDVYDVAVIRIRYIRNV